MKDAAGKGISTVHRAGSVEFTVHCNGRSDAKYSTPLFELYATALMAILKKYP